MIGYSLNDTVVIFDRVRENRGKFGVLSRKTVNDSINQTFSRTLLTGGTSIGILLVMYLLGGEGIHGFTFVMLLGIIVGTYSSIAVASPLLLVGRPADAKATGRPPVATAAAAGVSSPSHAMPSRAAGRGRDGARGAGRVSGDTSSSPAAPGRHMSRASGRESLMLVLRKEIKIGIAAGVAILGIAVVYGLMASISGGSKEQSAIVNTDTPTGDDKLKDAVGGLPPKDGEDAVKPTPAPPRSSSRSTRSPSRPTRSPKATAPTATPAATRWPH